MFFNNFIWAHLNTPKLELLIDLEEKQKEEIHGEMGKNYKWPVTIYEWYQRGKSLHMVVCLKFVKRN